jgi:polyhydroxyalkanoate synthase
MDGLPTGQTPRREISRKNKARLYRYEGVRRHGTPLLFVPNLGISRPWIFDLLPGSSFVEYMTGQGFDFYLLDWGVFGPEDDDLTFDEWLSILGYCMGTALAASLAASRPELPLGAFINLAGPIDFSKAGATLDLWWGLGDRQHVEELRAASKWVREFVGIPGEFFRQWVRDFYQDNRLYRGELSVANRPARLEAITCPVLAVGASDDPIAPPESVRAMLDVVGGHDKRWLEVPGSHLSLVIGAEASQRLWPLISDWLAARSDAAARASSHA